MNFKMHKNWFFFHWKISMKIFLTRINKKKKMKVFKGKNNSVKPKSYIFRTFIQEGVCFLFENYNKDPCEPVRKICEVPYFMKILSILLHKNLNSSNMGVLVSFVIILKNKSMLNFTFNKVSLSKESNWVLPDVDL